MDLAQTARLQLDCLRHQMANPRLFNDRESTKVLGYPGETIESLRGHLEAVTAPVHLGFDDKETISLARAVLNDDILEDAPGEVGERHEIRSSFDPIAFRRVVDGRLVARQCLILRLVGPLLLDRLVRLLNLFWVYPTDPGQ